MKILYGVPGEGMGHATRSKVAVSHLLKNHDVRVLSSSGAYHFLHNAFPGRVMEIEGFHLAYKNAGVSKVKTFTSALKSAPRNIVVNFKKYLELNSGFSPDLVISDFESFTFFYAKHFDIPIISIDNMQVINRCKLEFKIPRGEKRNYLIAKGIVKAKLPGCKNYLITSFFRPPVIKRPTLLVPPILRDKILNATPEAGTHILVYQTSQNQENLIALLQQLPDETFYVYGFNKESVFDNVILKSFSEEGFISHLASCKAVVANGGFSLISEAVYLKKPVCSIPLKNQFEQFVNAAYIEKSGYGRNFPELSQDALKSFLYDLEKFRKNLETYSQNGNEEFFLELDKAISALV